jgi:hypothetical protein
MFCPKCGKADQQEESYCRQCGNWLTDSPKQRRPEAPPETHLKANLVLNAMTIVASFTMAALLYAILGFRPGTHPLIYVAAAMFIAIGAWHIQTLIRTIKLRKQLRRRKGADMVETPSFKGPVTARELSAPTEQPASVTERTTRELHSIPRKLS